MRHKLKVGVIFGGRSVEHEVSVITALQAIKVMDKDLYDIVPIYINKQGEWFTGDALLEIANYRYHNAEMVGVSSASIPPDTSMHGLITPIKSGLFQQQKAINLDVVFPIIHGTHGEDGTIQGLLELANLPYVGCGVCAAAVGMSKLMTKKILYYHNIPILDARTVHRKDWEKSKKNVVEKLIEEGVKFPVFVKPANLGSSIGVSEVRSKEEVDDAVELVLSFDDVVMFEEPIHNLVEINCSVLGSDDEITPSVCEQPIPWSEFLSYEEKYMRSGRENQGMQGIDRYIPAPISAELTQQIQQTAVNAFRAIGGSGIARVDFFLDKENEQFYVNELNTTPGSLALYLWEPSGIKPSEVINKLIKLAIDTHAAKQKRVYSYDVGLLEKASAGGAKFGAKTATDVENK